MVQFPSSVPPNGPARLCDSAKTVQPTFFVMKIGIFYHEDDDDQNFHNNVVTVSRYPCDHHRQPVVHCLAPGEKDSAKYGPEDGHSLMQLYILIVIAICFIVLIICPSGSVPILYEKTFPAWHLRAKV